MIHVMRIVFILSLYTFTLSSASNGCPMKNSAENARTYSRGYGQPYGYHARQWKRIETLYEHPHPEEFYRKYMRGSLPVIIRGGAKDWPAVKKWTNVTYLNKKAGSGRAIIQWKNMYNYDKFHNVRVTMKMPEFTRNFEKHNLYMDTTLPNGLAEDVYWPKSLGCRFFQKRTKQLAVMFNNGKSSSDLHMDSTCTYFVQVTGKRRWLLSPPSEVEKTYSGEPGLVDHLGVSAVNQTHVDLEKHWLLKNLTIYGAFMNPGDIIYVPEGWHHQVKTYGSPNIGVVNFMNYLLCEFHSDTSELDKDHVKKCVFRIREQRPNTLKCNAFPEDKMTIPELLKKYPPPKPGVFMAPFEKHELYPRSLIRRMNNGEEIFPFGISLEGHNEKLKTKSDILKMALIEGFRMFCLNGNDDSASLLGYYMRHYKKFRFRTKVVAYLSKSNLGVKKASETIDSLLKNLNMSSLDVLILQTDYCPTENGTEPCKREKFTPQLLETWRVMEEAHRDGKVLSLGVSDFSLWELKELMKVNKVPVSIARARFDPYFRNKEFRQFCRGNKIIFMGRNLLGRRWKIERPDFPKNRDITKDYTIMRASFQYRTSVHGVVYDWATRKNVIICPPMDKSLYVRVNGQAMRSESRDNPDNLNTLDMETDPSDPGLFSPGHRNQLSSPETNDESQDADPVEVGSENLIYEDDLDNLHAAQYREMTASEKDYSKEVYTDDKDFERFPAYMNIKDPNIS